MQKVKNNLNEDQQQENLDDIDPENFPKPLKPRETELAASTTAGYTPTTHTQNFSFSSAYTVSRFNGLQQTNLNSNPNNNSQLFKLNFEPISAFTLLANDPLQPQQPLTYNAKPNAIVRPLRRFTDVNEDGGPRPVAAIDAKAPHENGLVQVRTTFNIHPQRLAADNATSKTYPSDGQGDELANPYDLRFLQRSKENQEGQGYVSHGGGTGWWSGKSYHTSGRAHSPTKSIYSVMSSRHIPAGTTYTQGTLEKRPLFITTVPTDVYLPPSNEVSLPAFLARRIYAFSSHPVIFNSGSAGGHYMANIAATTAPLYTSYSANHNYNYNKVVAPYNIYTKDKAFQQPHFLNNHKNSTTQQLIATGDKKKLSATNRGRMEKNTAGNGTGNGMVGSSDGSNSYAYDSPALASGIHVSKQQFHQQIQQRRANRETTAPVEPYKNVMYDRRVIRGSNFISTQLMSDSDPFDRAAELRRRHALRKNAQCRNQRNVLGTPPPVAGRRHEVIQTEKYLEDIVQRPPEFTVDTQTDLFLERPPTPSYIASKVGIDVATEIADGELFHFDAEAQPIIDILVDACIEQSILEVAHEQEIYELRKKQDEYLARREAELAELRRLEAEEIRLLAEKERRMRQDTIAKELDAEMQKGVTAAKLLQGHIASLLPEVLENLEPASDDAKKEQLIKTICPWLTKEVAEEVGHIVDSREILTVIIQEIIKQRAEAYAGYKEEKLIKNAQPPLVTEGEGEGEEEGEQDVVYCESESERSIGGVCDYEKF